MHDVRWWSWLRLLHACSLILLIVAGCGEKSGIGGGTASGGVSRLTLRVMVSSQGTSRIQSRAILPEQTRQANTMSLLRVEVSGEGIAGSIRADCPIPVGSAQCQVTETADAITTVIELTVPSGTGRQVTVTGFDQNGNIILSGTTTQDLTAAVQAVGVTINPVTGSVGVTAAAHGNGASGADEAPLTCIWALLTWPSDSQATVVCSTCVNPTLVVDRPGTYTVQLTVNNGQMDSLPEAVTIHTVDVDGNVLMPDDDLLPLVWSLIAAPPDSTAMLSNPSAETPNLTVDLPGTYVVQLVVNDGLMDRVPGDSGH